MSPDPFNDLDCTQTVKVLPRHLAGPGPVDLRTAWPFPFDKDWALHEPDEGTAYATSPCLRLWTRFVPERETRGKGTWTIGANRVPFGPMAWQIMLDAATPIELLHDIHVELFDLYPEDRYSDQDPLLEDATAPHEVYAPLFTRGWSHNVKPMARRPSSRPKGSLASGTGTPLAAPTGRPGEPGADTRANRTGRRPFRSGRPPRSSRPSPPR